MMMAEEVAVEAEAGSPRPGGGRGLGAKCPRACAQARRWSHAPRRARRVQGLVLVRSARNGGAASRGKAREEVPEIMGRGARKGRARG